jgi:hypothetical protein
MSSRFKLFYISFVSGLGWYVWGGSRRERERERERRRRSGDHLKRDPLVCLLRFVRWVFFFFKGKNYI